jgi:transposase
MCTLPVFVGLDYHDASVRVCVLDTDGRELANADRCNDWKAIAEFADRFGRPVRAAIESCCGAADLAEELVSCAGWSVDLAHPGYVQRMKQNPDKTDYQDAQLVADLERIGYLPRVWLAPQHIRELRQVVRYRLQLTEQRRATKLRVRALLREQRCRAPQGVNAWTKAWDHWLRHTAELSAEGRWVANQHLQELACLATRIRQVEKRLERLTANDVEVQRLQQQVGIGPVTAWTIRAEIGHFDRFRTGKQLARFCGLSPRNASSGQRQADAGLIRAANPALRTVLIEAAHRLVNYDRYWQKFAQRLRAAGKPGSVVAAAVANRWIRRLYHEMKTPSGELAVAVRSARSEDS